MAKAFGHFVEFGVLSLLVYRALYRKHVDWTKAAAISIFFCLTYAISDELHQTFVPGRHPSLSDIVIDVLGVITGMLVAVAISVKFPLNTVIFPNQVTTTRERNQ
tara:strand:+ start:1174 stop:1488 length:315 start_codon:yes stop_codon:yes gene_type:complete